MSSRYTAESRKEKCVVKKKGFVMEPPDGGWGYMICVAAAINFLVMTMFYGSFGIIFKDFLIQHDMGSTSITLLNGLTTMLTAIAAYLTSIFLKLLSLRKVLLLGATLCNVGAFGMIFVDSKVSFYICQGVQNFGLGIFFNVNYTLLNEYFVRKRFLVISIIQAISGAGAMIAPYLVTWTQKSFGYHGALVMISGISLHTLVAVALMQPVERHLVRVEVEEEAEEMKLFLKEKPPKDNVVNTPTITVTETNFPLDTKLIIKDEARPDKSQSFWTTLVDTALLKKFLLSNASMGPSYCCFADLTFALMLPDFLFSLGWDKDQVALAISLASFGDLVTRIIFIFTSKWLSKIGNQEIYLIAIAVAFLSRMLMLWSENTLAIMVFITLMGVSKCGLFVLIALVFADIFPQEQFSSALGLFMIISGLMTLILGPAVGAISDMTRSYSTAFYVITCCFAAVLLLWIIELVYKRSKHKRIMQREAAEKIKKNVKKNKAK